LPLSWIQKGLDIDGVAAGDSSGYAVAMSSDGTVVAIGAAHNDGLNGVDSGHVRVYFWDGFSWSQRGADMDGEAAGDLSGGAWARSLALSTDGNKLATQKEESNQSTALEEEERQRCSTAVDSATRSQIRTNQSNRDM